MKNILLTGLVLLIACGCSKNPPKNSVLSSENATIQPDYTSVSIPRNIAPLNFTIRNNGDEFLTITRSRKGQQLEAKGRNVKWKLNDWHKLLDENKGDTLYTQIYIKKGKQWFRFPVIRNYIAPEEIDNYISYRLIEPSYEVYEYMTINQRNLSNFDEEILYNNNTLARNDEGHCINCHAYQNYNKTHKLQFHVRQYKGGTIIATPAGIKKVNLKTDFSISAGVYPAWHPVKNLIAYSVNNTEQHFHKKGAEKVEVMDSRSDLILYDVDKNEVRNIANDTTALETFPAWSPDGKFLYYVSAQYPEGVGPKDSLITSYKNFRYNIYRKAFNSETLEFSTAELVFDAAAQKKSATLPRISPDGKYLLFTMGNYGNFHIWHKSADLYLIDIAKGTMLTMPEINSPETESYHSWSSNGSWIIFSSRRDDGSYTRPYITYFKDGRGHKPFILPQQDPERYSALFKSFNIPEFMVEPLRVTRKDLRKAIEKEPVKAAFVKPSSENTSAK
ncbi:MAG TPA: hypothetical protein VHO72_13350 [Bacteroidales bacterium]|nr:hypothetical protein [Bacteroidales bacterium]